MTQTSAREELQTGKVVRMTLYTMQDYAIPSRNDETYSVPRATFGPDEFHKALREFATSLERCRLVFELSNGREVAIYPSLKENAVAFGETKKEDTPAPKYPWQFMLEVWPR